jgi:hypothetical protein
MIRGSFVAKPRLPVYALKVTVPATLQKEQNKPLCSTVRVEPSTIVILLFRGFPISESTSHGTNLASRKMRFTRSSSLRLL